jgi:EmrB/QacA subfamily drug resistance transporter
MTVRRPSRWAALALVVAAQFMVVVDISIVNVALPAIKSDLHFSEESLQWVISAYAIVFGGFLLLGGRLADLLGRRRMFVVGVLVFTLTSALCGLAWSAGSLVAFRGIEGLGGALFAPAGLSLLMTTFPAGRDRNVALGIWGAASGSGAAVGVVLGGVLTSYLSWPWVFFINVPIGIAIVALAPRYLTEGRAPVLVNRHFDFAGAFSVTASLMVLVYALTEAAQHGWASARTIGLVAVAALLAVGFVAIERRARSPLLPFRVFRGNRLAPANVITCIIACIAFSQFFLLTLYMQQVLHYSPAQTGVAFAAIAVTVAVMSNVSQSLVTRFGAPRVLAAGLTLSATAAALLTRLPVHGHYVDDLLPSFVLAGAGLGVSFIAVTIAGLESVQPGDAGVASGLVNTSRQVGGAIGLAVVSTIATSYAGNLHAAASLTHGFRISFAALSLLALAGAILTGAMLRTPGPRTPAEEPVELRLEEAA